MLIRIWYNYAAPAPAGLLFGALGGLLPVRSPRL